MRYYPQLKNVDLVSIIMPSYNTGKYIAASVEFVLVQKDMVTMTVEEAGPLVMCISSRVLFYSKEYVKIQNVKKVLIVASVVSFIEWFNKENIEFLRTELGCEVHISCNFDYMEDTDEERTKLYLEKIKNEGVILHNIHFARSPFSLANIWAYRELKKIINAEHFCLVHTHTPVASIIARLAAIKSRKNGTVVMYTCHGFHFHKAAPKKNWFIYYPVEMLMSYFTDYLITINKEDFNIAKTFHATNVRYIPGVGVDIKRIKEAKVDKKSYKKSIGIPENCIMLLSIGEMIERKNHQVIIKALGKLKRDDIYYVICGKGPLREHLEQLSDSLGVHTVFLGFRRDIPELCNTADISAFPSRIEGLGLAGIEAMAAGVPLVSSNVHGILDYVIDGKTGYSYEPDDVDGFAIGINKLASSNELRRSMEKTCLKAVKPFEVHNALNCMWHIYREIIF